MIMHIDMDAFFASVEQQINPALKGKPVIVGARDNKYYTVVTAASYEAKAYGIDSGMPSREAFKICPHAEFVACDSAKYTYVSREILGLLGDFSPQIEHTTIDEFDIILDGLEPLFGPFLDIGRRVKNRIQEAFGLACSIGIAPTWLLAKLGSKLSKPDGLVLVNEANLDAFVKGVPVEKICGIGPALTGHLQGLGILTCDQLKKTPQEILVNNFGRATGHWLWAALRTDVILRPDRAFSTPQNHPPMFVAEKTPKSVGHSYTLSREISDQEIIFSWLRMLSEMVAERLRKYGLTGHTVSLWLSSKNESSLRQKTFQLPTSDGWEIFMRSKAILSQKKAYFRTIRALGVSLSGLISDATPPLLIEQKRRGDLIAAMDQINARYGDWTLSPAILSLLSATGKDK